MKNAWSTDDYEDKVLWLAMHKKGRTRARLINVFYKGFFERDRAVIRELAGATNVMDFQATLAAHKKELENSGGFLRRRWKCRISGSQLMQLGMQYFS